MKIKQDPDDFRVDELTDVSPSAGRFSLYRLDKTGWTTHDALNTVRRLWQVPAHRLSYGGLKDRHARTTQHLTIEHGPPKDLSYRGLAVTYLGAVAEPFTSAQIRANRFGVVVRDLPAVRAERALAALAEVRADGVGNYFDDQRFGSVSGGGDFMARQMVQGHWEQALKLALSAPYEFDRSAEKQLKATLRRHWGDWATAKARLPRSHARSLVDYLVAHPSDFRGAVARLRPDLSGLYLSAYQSHLWNRFLARFLASALQPEQRIDIHLKLETVPMPRGLTETQRAELTRLVLPLPSARLKYDEAIENAPAGWQEVLRATLAEDGVELEQLKLRGLRRPFFSRGERPVLCRPEHLEGASAADERHPGHCKFVLSFELPRGSYATLLIKRLTALEP